MISSVTPRPSALRVLNLCPVLPNAIQDGEVGVRGLPQGVLEVRVPLEVEGDKVRDVVWKDFAWLQKTQVVERWEELGMILRSIEFSIASSLTFWVFVVVVVTLVFFSVFLTSASPSLLPAAFLFFPFGFSSWDGRSTLRRMLCLLG